MADAYTVFDTAAVANPRTIGTLITATTRRAAIDAITLSCEGAPADNTIVWTAGKITTAGTVTSETPTPKDPASPASLLTSGQNASAEPTYTAGVTYLEMGLNQRSVFRAVYAPGKEIMTNLTASNGVGVKASHASATPTVDVQLEWTE